MDTPTEDNEHTQEELNGISTKPEHKEVKEFLSHIRYEEDI